MIRIGLWAHYTIMRIRNPQNSVGNYLGPCQRTLLLRGQELETAKKSQAPLRLIFATLGNQVLPQPSGVSRKGLGFRGLGFKGEFWLSLLEAELFGSQTCSEPNSQQRLMKKSSRASFKSSATCSSPTKLGDRMRRVPWPTVSKPNHQAARTCRVGPNAKHLTAHNAGSPQNS